MSASLDDAPTGRYLTIWLTTLPGGGTSFKGGIAEVVVSGS